MDKWMRNRLMFMNDQTSCFVQLMGACIDDAFQSALLPSQSLCLDSITMATLPTTGWKTVLSVLMPSLHSKGLLIHYIDLYIFVYINKYIHHATMHTYIYIDIYKYIHVHT